MYRIYFINQISYYAFSFENLWEAEVVVRRIGAAAIIFDNGNPVEQFVNGIFS